MSEPVQAPSSEAAAKTRRLTRFFFCLPDPLPFPTGRSLMTYFGGDHPIVLDADDPWVKLTFHQVDNQVGKTFGQFAAIDAVLDGLPELPTNDKKGELGRALPDVAYTVVDATTPSDSPEELDASTPVQDRSPRADAFVRCLRSVTDLVRAYRVADQHIAGIVTYERISPLVLWYSAESTVVKQVLPNGQEALVDQVAEWTGPSLLMLDHFNLPDWARPDDIDKTLARRIDHWREQMALSTPFFSWREKLADARWYLHAVGDHSTALIIAATAAEVLVDAMLALLLWEKGTSTHAAAERFDEGKVVRRLKSQFPELLKGSWNLEDVSHPVGSWLAHTVKLRNRVVHSGHQPTLQAVQTALESVFSLERHIFDQLATQRNTFPRSTLMTIAKSGLERRGLWAGRIKAFGEAEMSSVSDWRRQFATWHQEMTDTIAERSGGQ